MAILTITTFLTIDGVLQAPGRVDEDPRDGFELGGWIFPLFDEDTGRIVADWFADAEAFLLGRVTWQIFATHWPRVESTDTIPVKLNTLPKYVATRTLSDDDLDWDGSVAVPDVVSTVKRLKSELDGAIQVHGSGDLARTLLAEGLVDELRLITFPLIAGQGRRLFGDDPAQGLELVWSATTPSGAIAARYRPTGAPRTGSFSVDG